MSYNVTLSSSFDNVTLGPLTTTDTVYNFNTSVDTLNGNFTVSVLPFNDNAMGVSVARDAVIVVSSDG